MEAKPASRMRGTNGSREKREREGEGRVGGGNAQRTLHVSLYNPVPCARNIMPKGKTKQSITSPQPLRAWLIFRKGVTSILQGRDSLTRTGDKGDGSHGSAALASDL